MINTHSLDIETSSNQAAYITDGNQTGLDLAGDNTLEFWWKPETLISKAVLARWAGSERSYLLWGETDGTISASYSDDGTTNSGHYLKFTSTGTFTAGTWSHFACSFDISTETCEMYFDGSNETPSVAVGTGIGATLHNGTSDFCVGCGESHDTHFNDGKFDEVRVWSGVRTEGEINNYLNSQLYGGEPNLVSCWRLNNDYIDITSNGNTLTAVASPVFSTDVPFPGLQDGGNPMFFSSGGLGVA